MDGAGKASSRSRIQRSRPSPPHGSAGALRHCAGQPGTLMEREVDGGSSIALARSPLNKDFRDHAEQQHIAAQQKAALQHAHAHSSGYFITQDSAFGNLILPVLPRLEAE
ncbi:SOSS complex subunit C isoform X1 [Aptenodytes patagonicus]|uniref:SOSS complex subunit C isoform X1 n=1 Tax=Aptenodytes patagonicus TaxID=9234 RepID=UPI003F9FB6C1